MRSDLVHWPTPLEPMPRLSARISQKLALPERAVDLWIKRDDVMGLGGGGNKLRKLEWLLGDAVQVGADVVITCGAVQSNHARLTAAACARLGLECELWLGRAVPDRPTGYESTANPLLDQLFGATVHFVPGPRDPEQAAEEHADRLRRAGRNPYVIPTGGSNATGARGYADGAAEILRQADQNRVDFGTIVVACGSGGTLAGLAAGLGEAGWSGNLIGVSVSSPAGTAHDKATTLARQLTESAVPITVDDRFVGPGYGIPTVAGVDAIRSFARTEGILLDPVYTAKAAAGLLARVSDATESDGSSTLFVHTGGSPALFAYTEELS